ncbi:MAG: 16S rRNA (uracil(1498)-N(3))-methyltransferase [Simkaniaceae bacterium]
MPENRFFLAEALIPHKEVTLEDREFHHLAKVMRKRAGETVEVVNGKGLLAHARIESIKKENARLLILSVEKKERKGPEILLAQAMPKASKLDWILEKGTELGANRFLLFPGDGSEKTIVSKTQTERFHGIMISSIKQCGRLDLPKLEIYSDLQSLLIPEDSIKLYGDVTEDAKTLEEVKMHLEKKSLVTLFIGPEKGWSKKEREILAQKKCLPFKISLHTLRAETAAIAGLALLANLYLR